MSFFVSMLDFMALERFRMRITDLIHSSERVGGKEVHLHLPSS